MKTFRQVLQSKEPLLFDGAMGTELYKRGIFINKCFEEANIISPELVCSVHRDYRNAGAEVLTTNSWGAGRYKLARYNLQDKISNINRMAVQLARSEAGEACFVAGSVGPLGPRLEPVGALSLEEAKIAFCEQIAALVDGGVDLIILETFGDVREAVVALNATREVSQQIPVIASLTIDMDGNPLFGMWLEEAMDLLVEAGVDVIGLNCSVGPQPMLRAARRMRAHNSSIPLCIEPNAGLPRQIDGRMIYMSTPEYFATYARYYLQEGVRLVGGCCGTTPEHIRAMSASVRQYRAMQMSPSTRFVSIEITPSQSRGLSEGIESAGFQTQSVIHPVPFAEKSAFASKLASGSMVYTLELVPPKGTTLDSLIEKAKRAKEAGIDAINIPDGPRASSRLSTLVTAIMIEQKTGLETILHYTCRDRNIISMQADLLGAQTIGLRNILCITGDPPKLGDYPDATGVFDIDSIGLTRMIHRLNCGFDISGKPIGSPTSLSHGVGVNPGNMNFASEMERFRKKIEAGAEWTMTQPIFDPTLMERFLDFLIKEGINIPVIMGIWPLTSLKNALFMKNEIPGIEIPNSIVTRMERCTTLESAREEGVAIARELFDTFKDSIQGVQLSAPFGKIELALKVIGQ